MAVATAGGADRQRIAALLARAFADDPAFAWIYPDPADRAHRLPRLFALMLDSDAQAGMALTTTDGAAATLWRGPGRAQVGWGEMLRRGWPLWRALGRNVPRALKVGDAIDAHMPAGDFWYLHVVGCDPEHQRQGFGRAAVRGGLARIGDRLPVYLETAAEANLGFYAGFDFRVTGAWQVPGDGPRFWSMLRG